MTVICMSDPFWLTLPFPLLQQTALMHGVLEARTARPIFSSIDEVHDVKLLDQSNWPLSSFSGHQKLRHLSELSEKNGIFHFTSLRQREIRDFNSVLVPVRENECLDSTTSTLLHQRNERSPSDRCAEHEARIHSLLFLLLSFPPTQLNPPRDKRQ